MLGSFSNNKLLKNLEEEGEKGKKDFLHKYHIIMEQGFEFRLSKKFGHGRNHRISRNFAEILNTVMEYNMA